MGAYTERSKAGFLRPPVAVVEIHRPLFTGLWLVKYAMTCIETAKNDMMANEIMMVPNALSIISLLLVQVLSRYLRCMLPVNE